MVDFLILYDLSQCLVLLKFLLIFVSELTMVTLLTLNIFISVITAQSFTKIGNNNAPNMFRINGIGADKFNPNKMSNWHYDYRFPLIAAKESGSCPKNIYAPSAVNNGESTWNIYFGGWDGVSSCHDSISVTVTEDAFISFNPHFSQIATGNEMHVNNPNCLKLNDSFWSMVYTVLPLNSNINKPGFSTSTKVKSNDAQKCRNDLKFGEIFRY